MSTHDNKPNTKTEAQIKSKQERQKILAQATELVGQNRDYVPVYENASANQPKPDQDLQQEIYLLTEECSKKAKEAENNGDTTEKQAWLNLRAQVKSLWNHAEPVLVDLSRHPNPRDILPALPGSQSTVGDTHGNFIKLLYILIDRGFLTLKNSAQYDTLVELYQKTDLTREDLQRFDSILAEASLLPDVSFRFIGDEVGDRGGNDIFTLKMMRKLHTGRPPEKPGQPSVTIPFETEFSDHGAEFIDFYEKGCPPSYEAPHLKNGFARSVENLSELVRRGVVSSQELSDMIEESYLPNLRVMSYSIDPANNRISRHGHTPVGLKTIESLARKFNVMPDTTSPKGIASTLDQINIKFQELAKNKKISAVMAEEYNIFANQPWIKAGGNFEEYKRIMAEKPNLSPELAWIQAGADLLTAEELLNKPSSTVAGADLDTPLLRTIWTRYDSDPIKELETEAEETRDFVIQYVHGHDEAGWVPSVCSSMIRNIDDILGKDSDGTRILSKPDYLRIHYNFEMTSKQYQLHLEQERQKSEEQVVVTRSPPPPPKAPLLTSFHFHQSQQQVTESIEITSKGTSKDNIMEDFKIVEQKQKSGDFQIVESDFPKKITLEISKKVGGKEEITQEFDQDNNLSSKLRARDPEDNAYTILASVNAIHQPLFLKYHPDLDKVLKTLEACVRQNVKIFLSKKNFEDLLKLASTDPKRELFLLLTQNEGQEYKDRMDNLTPDRRNTRKLGDPLPAPSEGRKPLMP